MSHRLPIVLSEHDLPLAELAAARLDGELFRVDDCFAPVDEIEQTSHRAAALNAIVPERLIAEQHTAAWLWGALDTPPAHHELCVAVGARTRSPTVNWMRVREVVIEPTEIAAVDGMLLTSPLRTTVDLARFSIEFGEAEELIVIRLMMQFGFGVAACVDDMHCRRNLPNKRRAIERLEKLQLPALDPIDIVNGVDAPHRAEYAVEVGGVSHLENEAAQSQPLARGGDGRRQDVYVVLTQNPRDIG